MTDRLQNISGNGNGYFSQAVADYAARMKPEEKQGEGRPKTIGEFSKDEWENLLDKVDNAIEDYKEDLKERKEEAFDKQKKQREAYALGCGENKDRQYEEQVMLDNGSFRTIRFMKVEGMESESSTLPEQPDIKDTIEDMVADEAIKKLLYKGNRAPYSLLADEGGVVKYNGVNIDDLVKAISMFSPEDINRIMRAIAQDAKLKQIKMQIEDETSGIEVLEKPEEEEKINGSKRQNEQPDF